MKVKNWKWNNGEDDGREKAENLNQPLSKSLALYTGLSWEQS